ncbi:MAG: Uma2 family endonuclease, partial [Gemmataceae bacterium]
MSSAPPEIVYPFSDGEPMADNMLQGQWMVMLWSNLDDLLSCFVGINNFWFPVEGEPELRLAPDVYAAFGRPKGHRDSYLQWKEDDTPVTVVIEIWSPGNNLGDMEHKYDFYEEHGVEEYYVYDPYRNHLDIYLRRRTALRRVWAVDGFVSPRMGIRFDLSSAETLTVWRPDGRKFLTLSEQREEWAKAEAARQQAEAGREAEAAARQQAEAGREAEAAARRQA